MKLIEAIKEYKSALKVFTAILKEEDIDVEKFFLKYPVKYQYAIVQDILTKHYNLTLYFTNSRYKIILEKLLGDEIIIEEVHLLEPLDDDIYILAMQNLFKIFNNLLNRKVDDLPF